jgi:hypothetical protein
MVNEQAGGAKGNNGFGNIDGVAQQFPNHPSVPAISEEGILLRKHSLRHHLVDDFKSSFVVEYQEARTWWQWPKQVCTFCQSQPFCNHLFIQIDPEEAYEVERTLDIHMYRGKLQYRVK